MSIEFTASRNRITGAWELATTNTPYTIRCVFYYYNRREAERAFRAYVREQIAAAAA